ncbi:MAG TPA: ribbon-helix-helix protein, CopG family [Gemmatimonadales bacterium]|nr:ribbon-helix-helix protein, CopG family [Gemmatimonadales bacterium]
MSKKVSAVNTSVYLDRDTLRLIDAAADMADVSRSQFIQRAGLKAARKALEPRISEEQADS